MRRPLTVARIGLKAVGHTAKIICAVVMSYWGSMDEIYGNSEQFGDVVPEISTIKDDVVKEKKKRKLAKKRLRRKHCSQTQRNYINDKTKATMSLEIA